METTKKKEKEMMKYQKVLTSKMKEIKTKTLNNSLMSDRSSTKIKSPVTIAETPNTKMDH